MAKEKRLLISLDIDDVLADFMPAALAALGEPSHPDGNSLISMYPERKEDALALIADGNFHYGLGPVFGAVKGAWTMARDCDADSVYISARLPKMTEMTMAWLERYGFPAGDVHCLGRNNGAKAERIQELGCAISIEDYPITLDEITLMTDSVPVVFTRRWNIGYDGVRMDNWYQWRRAMDKAMVIVARNA